MHGKLEELCTKIVRYLLDVFKAGCKTAFTSSLKQDLKSSYLGAYTGIGGVNRDMKSCYVLYNSSFGQNDVVTIDWC